MTKKGDIQTKNKKQDWFYSDKVKQHFFNPYKFMKEDEEKKFKADGVGQVGSPACGDMMKFWIKVDKKSKKIVDCRWRTYGCGSAIASTSALAEMLLENGGMDIKKALKLKPQDILKRLNGLPAVKVHCSVLGDKALRAAIKDYRET
tara:strand:+ start:469 stop:909 length:441 start_codon:yes stop_codon:yes gene_type:complete